MNGEGFGAPGSEDLREIADDEFIRERVTAAHELDPAEIRHDQQAQTLPSI